MDHLGASTKSGTLFLPLLNTAFKQRRTMNVRKLLLFVSAFNFALGFTWGNTVPIISFSDFAYEFTVTVLDEQGQPLPGVNIFSEDKKTVATSTDFDGKAILVDVNYRELITFSFIGYEELQLPFYEIRKKSGKVKLNPVVEKLKEIVVLGRRDDTPDKVPYSTSQITEEDISKTEAQTAADVLQQHAGVYVQKSQMGGGSPVIRGFEANRVLLVVDGVRMNNAIYRSGHLQNAITIDNGMLERVEVTYGPGSLLYGSDALGGVVHYRSKEPKLNFDKTPDSYRMITNMFSRYSTANDEKSVHADINYGQRKWASLSSFTFTDYGDLRSGSNRPEGFEHFGRRLWYVERVDGIDQQIPNVTLNPDSTFSDNYDVQVGTAYTQMDFTQKVKIQPSEKRYHLFNFQFSTTSDVPRYDNLSEMSGGRPKFSEWFYGPQKRLLFSVKNRFSNPTKYFDKATVIASFQKIDEDRLRRRWRRSQREYNLEDVQVYSLTADFDKNLDSIGQHQLMYGTEVNLNRVNSEAGLLRMSDESIVLGQLTRYPGGNNRTLNAAAYANYRWSSVDSSLVFNGGLRYTWANLYSEFTPDSIIIWPQFYLDGISNTHSDLTWSGGLTYSTPSKFQARLMASKAFRSPNLDDFSKVREQNNIVTIPNPFLKPETTVNYELSLAKQFGGIQNGKGIAAMLSVTGYHTQMRNLMVRRRFALPDGSFKLVMGGDTLSTVSNVNSATGYIQGVSFNFELNLGSRIRLNSDLTFTNSKEQFQSRDDDDNILIDTLVPGSHIPPTYGQTSLSFTGKKFSIMAAVRYQGKKTVDQYGVVNIFENDAGETIVEREGGSDNIELGYTELGPEGEETFIGTLGYTTYNLYTSYQFNERYSINFSIENITDLHYRQFASGVSAPGRNFIVSLRARLGE